MKKVLLTLTIVLVSYSLIFAQEHMVQGTVTSTEGSAIPGITVQVKGSKNGTATNAQGDYQISAPETAELIFRGIGYNQQIISIKGRTTINVSMEPSMSRLNELVVVGYGTGRKLGSVVGSVATVSSDVVQEKPVANVLDAMQGQVAGVQILTSSGEPDATSSITIHGVGSLGAGSTPLFVLDGTPVDKGTVLSLNPNDFASITVLKDASATSIYGSRAANGVVYITTKSGKLNGKNVFTLTAQHGVSDLANTDQFTRMMTTKQLTDLWVETGYQTQAQVDALLEKYPNNTRWYKYYYKRNTPTDKLNASFRGGAGKTTYFVSASYMNQNGVAYRSNYQRYTLRSNIASQLNNWLKFGLNLGIGYDKRQTNGWGSNNTNRGLAMLAQPFYTPYDSTGKPYPQLIPGWDHYNPKYLAEMYPSDVDNLQFTPTTYVELTPLQGLTLKTQFGMDAFDYRLTSKRMPSYVGSLHDGSLNEYFRRGYTNTITNTGEYKFDADGGMHNFTILVGQEYINNVDKNFNSSSTGQSDDRLMLLQNGPNNKDGSSGESQYAFSSYFARLDYNYLSKYYLNASVRNDASSRFGKNHRHATFWSVGGMWQAKEEHFLQNVDWIKDLRLRVSYGTSGNSDIGNYNSLALVGTSQYDASSGWHISNAGNPNLTWETQKQTNIGIDANLFNVFDLTLDFYNRLTSNMLIDVPYPYTSGFSTITTNTGDLKNSGIDVHIAINAFKSANAYIKPYVNFTYNKNEVTKLFQGKDHWIIPNTGVCWVVGQPVMFFYPVFADIDPKTGAPQWYEPNPDDIAHSHLDPKDVTTTFNDDALQQNTGKKRYAPINGGFGLNAGYKGFYVQIDFAFVLGKNLINNDRYFFENPNVFTGYNQSSRVLDYWKKEGDHSLFPAYSYQFTQFDSRLIENASFMRLKNMVIGYTFSNKLISHTGFLSGAKIFLTGRNLITVTNYLGPDPEVASNLTYGVYPNTRQYMAGIQFQF